MDVSREVRQRVNTRRIGWKAADVRVVLAVLLGAFRRDGAGPRLIRQAARNTEAKGIIAPPTFPQAMAQFDPEYRLRPKPGQPWFGSGKTATGITEKAASSGGLHALG